MSRYDLWDEEGNFKGEVTSKGRSDRLKELWDKEGNLKHTKQDIYGRYENE